MIKISIIMPLFNAEKYLEECITSILNQSLTEFELICVNDASTDSTADILQEFAHIDGRIKILNNNERIGAANSRNKGMKEAQGKYLSFLDGDDVFDEDMLKIAYITAEEKNAEIVFYDARSFLNEEVPQKKYKVWHGQEYKEKYCMNLFSLEKCEPYNVHIFGTAPWQRIYDRNYIISNGLEFQDLNNGNDVYFVVMAMMLSNRIMVVDNERVLLYYRNHLGNTRITNNRDPMCYYLSWEKVQNELLVRDKFQLFYEHFYYSSLFGFIGVLSDTTISENKRKNFYTYLQAKGIKCLKQNGGEWYEKSDKNIKSLINCFLDKSFESAWYANVSRFDLSLSIYKEQLLQLFKSFQSRGERIGIWGAGKNGQFLLRFCNKNQIKIDAVIDVSEKKQGQILADHCIISPHEISNDISVIVISSKNVYFEDVINELYSKNVKIIDIYHYLGMA